MNCKWVKIIALIGAIVMMFSSLCVSAATPPETSTAALLLIDADTGEVLYGKNENARMYPASTTKIMVALLALENLELDEVVTANNSALGLLPPGHTNIGILNGEQLTVRQLLYALMLPSAGDAANVLGERISGSVDEFVKLMNKRALELGMKNTNYMNASGAHDELHYTTASDMALLARTVMKNATFREIVATDVYIIGATEKYPEERRLLNTNHLVSKKRSSKYFYEYATGIKTGFTNPAKRCLVSSASKNGINLICVALGADIIDGEQMDFVDSRNLFEYGFSSYVRKPVVQKGEVISEVKIKSAKGDDDHVLLEAGADISQLLPNDKKLGEVTRKATLYKNEVEAPIKKGEVLGEMEYFVDSVSVGKVPLVATKDYARDPIKHIFNVIISILTSPWLYMPFVLFFVALVIIRQYNYNKRKKQRALARRQQKQVEAEARRAAMRKDKYLEDFLKK
ncbi:MAG: D-alanyl-D-alanine carboxypeptidase [Clostridia bacterium]|nr:D-alanyl-D-alanine carboxypeptidase [Clostridia bacterium]